MKQAWMGVKQYLDEKLIRAQGKRKWELFEKLQEIVSFKRWIQKKTDLDIFFN